MLTSGWRSMTEPPGFGGMGAKPFGRLNLTGGSLITFQPLSLPRPAPPYPQGQGKFDRRHHLQPARRSGARHRKRSPRSGGLEVRRLQRQADPFRLSLKAESAQPQGSLSPPECHVLRVAELRGQVGLAIRRVPELSRGTLRKLDNASSGLPLSPPPLRCHRPECLSPCLLVLLLSQLGHQAFQGSAGMRRRRPSFMDSSLPEASNS